MVLPEGFPFSIDEVREAARRWLPDHVDPIVNDLVDEAARTLRLHNEQTERMRQSGLAPDHEIEFYIPDAVLAHLTLVSSSAAERVRAVMERRWAHTRAREIERERRRAAERAGIIPSMDDLLDEAERRGEFSWNDLEVFRGMVVSGANLFPEPPPATPEVIAIAERHVAEDIAEWEAIVAAATAGAPLPLRPSVIWDGDEAMPESELPDEEPNWKFIDDYIERGDRHQGGEGRLFASLASERRRFNAELVRALRVSPVRAVPRVLVYQFLEGHNGLLTLDSAVGEALSVALGEHEPRRTQLNTEVVYEAADLLEWYEANRAHYERYPLFDEWRARKRTRRDVIWMRLVRDRRDELFPVMSDEEPDDSPDTPPGAAE